MHQILNTSVVPGMEDLLLRQEHDINDRIIKAGMKASIQGCKHDSLDRNMTVRIESSKLNRTTKEGIET